MQLPGAAITALNCGRFKDELFADIGSFLQRSGIAERKTGTATRKRPTEVAFGSDEYFNLELRVSGSSSDNLGEHSASDALRRRWRVVTGFGAASIAPTRDGLPRKQGIRDGGFSPTDRGVRDGHGIQDRQACHPGCRC